jgi:hypothetical protein
VKTKDEVKSVLQFISESSATENFIKMWNIESNFHLWEFKPSKVTTFKAMKGVTRERFDSFWEYMHFRGYFPDDYNFIFGWKCEKDKLKLFSHMQNWAMVYSYCIHITPEDEPEIREYLVRKSEFAMKSFSVLNSIPKVRINNT